MPKPLPPLPHDLAARAHAATAAVHGTGAWSLDPATGATRWCAAARALLRLPADASPTLVALVDARDAEGGPRRRALEAALAAARTEAHGWRGSLPLRTGSGLRQWVELELAPVIENGHCIEILGTLRCHRKARAQARQLAQSRRQLRSLELALRLGGGPMLHLDEAGTIQACDRAFLQSAGGDTGALVARPLSALVDPRDADALQATLAQARRQPNARQTTTLRLVLPDRAPRWLRLGIAWSPVQDAFVCVCADVTDLKETEQHLHKLARIVRQMEHAVLITDPVGRITFVNPAFTRTTGHRADEVLGRLPSSFMLAPDSDPAVVARIRHAFDNHEPFVGEIRKMRKDGSGYWAGMEFVPLFDADGAFEGVMSIQRDITSQKQAEAELRAATAEARRSAAAAERANQAKSAFLAMMSHEIRTPLNGVLGMAQLLQATALDPTQADHIARIGTAGNALLNIINDILDFSKIEAGRLELEAVPFALPETVEDVLQLQRPVAEAKGLALDLGIDAALPPLLLGDPGRVRQVVLNLVSNAVKFTAQGRVSVELAPGPDGIRLCVSDTGIGIPAARQAQLFRPFTQVDASTRRHFGGTGLGLAISRQLVEAMGGTITLQSTEGVGSCFTIHLPLPVATAPARSPAAPAPLRDDVGAGLRVLLAEDNPVNQLVAVTMLRDAGCEVDVAANGQEALVMASQFPYDLVFMDCHMPVCDGWEATRRIRARPGLHQPVIIALTANAMKGDREACLDAGMDDHLAKPVRREGLLAMLQRWVVPDARRAAG